MRSLIPALDPVVAILAYPAAWLLRSIRAAGVETMPWCRRALLRVGVFPIANHYYEPLFDGRALRHPLSQDRRLPGIDWNVREQLELLSAFRFQDELADLAEGVSRSLEFDIDNGAFGRGDAEFFYNLIRLKRPRTIIEIGSGHSTLLAIRANRRNEEESPGSRCRHICIEPYEMPWLESAGVAVVRKRVEDVGTDMFAQLGENDILFIDSSHVIKPQSDVLFEYLELLPQLRKGVIVHIHDIYSPRDYPEKWILEEVRLWNEQYLVEAFLTNNSAWKIIGALNFLSHRYFEKLRAKCPFLTPEGQPGSFYIQKLV